MKQLEIELTRLAIWYVAAYLLGFIITMLALYYVIRSAIRDGIRDSGLVQTWQRIVASQMKPHADTLPPDIRADR